MNFRETPFTIAKVIDMKENDDVFARRKYVLKYLDNISIEYTVSDSDNPDIEYFTMKANVNGERIGLIKGIQVSICGILENLKELYFWCDSEDTVLPDLYLCLLRYVLPMQYIEFFRESSSMSAICKAGLASEDLYERLSDSGKLFESKALLVTEMYVEKEYRNSGLLSSCLSVIDEIVAPFGIALSVNPVEEVEGSRDLEIYPFAESTEEKEKNIDIAKHLGFTIADKFINDTTPDNVKFGVRASKIQGYDLEKTDFEPYIDEIDSKDVLFTDCLYSPMHSRLEKTLRNQFFPC